MGLPMKIRFALIALAATAATAAPAQASSIVYLKDGNVQLAAPDGSAARQITTGGDWESPSQADGGRIFAVKKGEENGYPVRRIYTFDRKGTLLGTPVKAGYTNSSTFIGPIRAQSNPSGSLLTYHYFYDGEPGISYAPPDKDSEYFDYGNLNGYINPAWYDDTHVVTFAVGLLPNVLIDSPGPGNQTNGDSFGWFTDPDADLSAGEINRQLTAFAAIRDDGKELRLYRMNGAPPAAPTVTCSVTGTALANPSWSPDGTELAFEDSDGVHVLAIGGAIDDCPHIVESLVIPGGSDPDWASPEAPSTGGGSGAGPTVTIGGPRKLKLKALLKGPSFPVTCSSPCAAQAILGLDRKTGKKLGFGSHEANVIGRGQAALINGFGTVRVRLTARAVKKLRKARSFKAKLVVVGTDRSGADGKPKVATLTIKR